MRSHIFRHLPIAAAVVLGAFLAVAAPAQDAKPAAPDDEPKKSAVPPKPESSVDARRRALELLADAELALEEGQAARAVALAREAQRLYPESKAISGFLAASQADSAPARATLSTNNRAKAHLAAALTRAQVLMQQRRYTESLDLLNGIVEAAQKFPAGTDVTLYRDLAQKELIDYRIGVQTGKIRPSDEAMPPKTEAKNGGETGSAKIEAPTADFTTAPSNAYRIARVSTREQPPAWYTRTKTALRHTMTVDYRAMPLGLVLDDIQRASGVTLIVDTPVQAAKTPLTALIDLRVSTVPAETVLMLATQVAGCEYVLLDKGVIITTPDKAGDYIRNLPEAVSSHWARARFLFPDLYLDAMANRPLPEVKPTPAVTQDEKPDTVPSFLRSGRDLVAHIEQLVR